MREFTLKDCPTHDELEAFFQYVEQNKSWHNKVNLWFDSTYVMSEHGKAIDYVLRIVAGITMTTLLKLLDDEAWKQQKEISAVGAVSSGFASMAIRAVMNSQLQIPEPADWVVEALNISDLQAKRNILIRGGNLPKPNAVPSPQLQARLEVLRSGSVPQHSN